MRRHLNDKTLAKWIPLVLLSILTIMCFCWFIYTEDMNCLLPPLILHIKYAFGVLAYDRRYENTPEPEDPWVRFKYMMFRFY